MNARKIILVAKMQNASILSDRMIVNANQDISRMARNVSVMINTRKSFLILI